MYFKSNQIHPLVTLLGFLTDDSLELPEGSSLLSSLSWFVSTLTMEFSLFLREFSEKNNQFYDLGDGETSRETLTQVPGGESDAAGQDCLHHLQVGLAGVGEDPGLRVQT